MKHYLKETNLQFANKSLQGVFGAYHFVALSGEQFEMSEGIRGFGYNGVLTFDAFGVGVITTTNGLIESTPIEPKVNEVVQEWEDDMSWLPCAD